MPISAKLLKGEDVNTLNNLYTKKNDLVARDIAEETIIVPIRSNVGDLDSIYTLNEIGSMIWQLIDGKNSVREIAKAVCNAFEVTLQVAEKDTIDFLNTLEQASLVSSSKE
jgi:hypothetical protein